MYIPKSHWKKITKQKFRSAAMLTLYAGSLIGCNVANSAETEPLAVSEQITEILPTNAQQSQIEPTVALATATPPPAIQALPTVVPPTAVPPTDVPPTAVQPTAIPPTAVPPTAVPPTAVPPTAVPVQNNGQYVNGSYLGDAIAGDRWGDMTVRAIIEGGQLVNIEIVAYPSSTRKSDTTSRSALPTLISEAITNQSADIDIVSRATDTSVAFRQSLETALEDAAIGNS